MFPAKSQKTCKYYYNFYLTRLCSPITWPEFPSICLQEEEKLQKKNVTQGIEFQISKLIVLITFDKCVSNFPVFNWVIYKFGVIHKFAIAAVLNI